MPTMWDMIAESILKQAGPLVEDLLPKIKDIVYDQTMRALRDYHSISPFLDPLPPLPPSPVEPGPTETIVIADMDTIPDRMRQAGFQGSDNALYYSLAYVAAFGPGTMPDDGAGSLVELSRRSPEIEAWWKVQILNAAFTMRKMPNLTAVAIANDGRDRCGFRLGEAIMRDLREFGNRVTLGQITPESEY